MSAIALGLSAAGSLFNAFTSATQLAEAAKIKPVRPDYEVNKAFGSYENMQKNNMFAPSQALLNARDNYNRTTAASSAMAENTGMSASQRAAMAMANNSGQARNNQNLMSTEESIKSQRESRYLDAVMRNDAEKKYKYADDYRKYMEDQDRKDTLNALAMNNLQEGIQNLGTTALLAGKFPGQSDELDTFGKRFKAWGENFGSNSMALQNAWSNSSTNYQIPNAYGGGSLNGDYLSAGNYNNGWSSSGYNGLLRPSLNNLFD